MEFIHQYLLLMISSDQKGSSQIVSEPFRVEQALVGLELGPADEKVIQYLAFFSDFIPVNAGFFLHVLPYLDVLEKEVLQEQEGESRDFMLSHNVINQLKFKIEDSGIPENIHYREFDVKTGHPLKAFLEDAKDRRVDLLVIGQRTNTDKHGIYASRMARESKANTLVIPDTSSISLKKIIVPIDFSEQSLKVLRVALGINQRLPEMAEIICLHVFRMPDFSFYNIQKTPEEYRQTIFENKDKAMEELLAKIGESDQTQLSGVIEEIENGSIAQTIQRYSQNQEADLLVMGAKGHSNLDLVMIGSITEGVLNLNCELPMLIVR
jgi:nucleotide-binding universal stress UspA family protein